MTHYRVKFLRPFIRPFALISEFVITNNLLQCP